MATRAQTRYSDSKADVRLAERAAAALVRYRVRLSLVLFLLLIVDDVLEGVRPSHVRFFTDPWARIGLDLVLIGIGIRSWAGGVISKGSALACTGPYSLTRHPLYVGSLLMTVGFCTLLADGRNVWIAIVATALLYLVRLSREEYTLEAKFGENWRQYVARTALLFPRRLPVALGCHWSFRQWLKNREYRALIAALVGLFALKFWYQFV